MNGVIRWGGLVIVVMFNFSVGFLFACFLDWEKYEGISCFSSGDGVYIKSERMIEVQEKLLSERRIKHAHG